MSFHDSNEQGYGSFLQGCRWKKMNMASKGFGFILIEQKHGTFILLMLRATFQNSAALFSCCLGRKGPGCCAFKRQLVTQLVTAKILSSIVNDNRSIPPLTASHFLLPFISPPNKQGLRIERKGVYETNVIYDRNLLSRIHTVKLQCHEYCIKGASSNCHIGVNDSSNHLSLLAKTLTKETHNSSDFITANIKNTSEMITKVTHMFFYKMDYLSTQCEPCLIEAEAACALEMCVMEWTELLSGSEDTTVQPSDFLCPSKNATKPAPGTINVQWAENASGHFAPSWGRWQQRNNRKWGETGMENDTQQMSPARLVPQTARNQSNLLSCCDTKRSEWCRAWFSQLKPVFI